MDDTPFLDDYTGQSTDELIKLAAEYRIDSIVCAFETAVLPQSLERTGCPKTFAVTQEALRIVGTAADDDDPLEALNECDEQNRNRSAIDLTSR